MKRIGKADDKIADTVNHEWTGCRVEATEDGNCGFVVRVWCGDESLIAVHVPPPDKRSEPRWWNSTEFGGLLTRHLYAKISARDAKRLQKTPAKITEKSPGRALLSAPRKISTEKLPPEKTTRHAIGARRSVPATTRRVGKL